MLVVGAGLGGLTAAIACRQRGFTVDVFEQAGVLGEVGAGLTVSRSAQSVLAALGILAAVQARASITPRMAFAHYRCGRVLAGGIDRGDGRWSPDAAPGGIHIHRADLHALLVERFETLAPGRLHLGKRLVAIEQNGGVTARFADGGSATGDLLVGADGVRSAVRGLLWDAAPPRFAGQVAYRFMVPGDIAAPFLTCLGRAAAFQGPGRVFNRYTLRAGAVVNCVAIAQSDGWAGVGQAGADEAWSTPAEVSELLALHDGWHPDVTGLMAVAPPGQLVKWALFDRPPLDGWRRGRVALLGDAAHPMLPFLGLGAAMAIEDGMVLARVLAADPGVAGLARYEALRRPRAHQITDLSRIQGALLQSRDPDRYDPASAPAQSAGIQDYDPVTIPIDEAKTR